MVIIYWIVLIAVIVFIFLYVTWSEEAAPSPSPPPSPPIIIINNELKDFEYYFVETLPVYFSRKAEKIANPTRQWSSSSGFVGLDPWTSTVDFGTFCHTMIGYAVNFVDKNSNQYYDEQIGYNLLMCLRLLSHHLPDTPPVQNAPWGPVADWYHFSITMPEVYMTVTCVLKDTIYYETAAELTKTTLSKYLPTATTSLGWVRTAGNAMRMGVPYVYSQLLKGFNISQIRMQDSVQDVLKIISFPFVTEGNGLHIDSIYIDHIDVRAYGYLINSFFTFGYYMWFFGSDVINHYGLTKSILNVSSPEGIVNPAVMSRQGTMFSNVIGNFVDYKIAVHSADVSKVLTKLTNKYYGCCVGYTTKLAYYEADPTNFNHAPLWAMNRRLWRRDYPIINYTPETVGFESGVLLQDLSGRWPVPSTTTSTQSFRPVMAKTAVVKNETLGAMLGYAKIKELNDLEFYSCTVYYETGMVQLYYNMKIPVDTLSINPRMVILTKPVIDQSTNWSTSNSFNTATFNGVTCHHVNIINLAGLANYVYRQVNAVENIEQIIARSVLEEGMGMSCYKLTVTETNDSVTVTNNSKYNNFTVNIPNEGIFIFYFPYLALYDDNQLIISNADEDNEIPKMIVDSFIYQFDIQADMEPFNCVLINDFYRIFTDEYSFIFNKLS
ncbi:odv-e66 [Cryptophlebia peltastica nucleopolyhedrovirus]|uniref:Odv-e66 n=1 Tax=Cryptophlebia peltastica nucleopolyhedrovirus TaxID=2304025 RepID=A0A346RNQ1_9ABAC|nr:odv-e66 [Cryptophlebia peltastica nucleopolyhedrovirus]AXS67698.1 odv-e66 [Cryptophlebia peltastica nucleopolyhedrovirus]